MLAVGLQEADPPFFLQSSSVTKLKDGSCIHEFIVQKRSMECKRLFVGLQERTTTTIYSINWSHVVLFPRKNA